MHIYNYIKSHSHLATSGAQGGTRTRTLEEPRPSTVCVYQFHHLGNLSKVYNKVYFFQFVDFLEFQFKLKTMESKQPGVIARLKSSIILPTRIEKVDDVLIFCKLFSLNKEDLELVHRILLQFVFTPNFKNPKPLLNSELYKFGVRLLLASIIVTHKKRKRRGFKCHKGRYRFV